MSTLDLSRPSRKAHLGLFRYSGWDAVPATLLALQIILIVGFVAAFNHLGWGARLGCGIAYALSLGWCIDTVAHNFVHNPFFVSERLNRTWRWLFSVVQGTPQTVYSYTHMRHHAGSSDRIGPNGRTVDPISLFQYGRDDNPEPAWRYVLLQYWRDEAALKIIRKIAARRPKEAQEARMEFAVMLAAYAGVLLVDWRGALFLLPFFYLGQCFSSLIAYYEHFGADPEAPAAALGVSTYEPVYNFLFLNNGYHAEHHHRPKAHWTTMPRVRAETKAEQAAAGLRTLRAAHFLGALEPWTWRVKTAAASLRRRAPAD